MHDNGIIVFVNKRYLNLLLGRKKRVVKKVKNKVQTLKARPKTNQEGWIVNMCDVECREEWAESNELMKKVTLYL